jgi:hypothetical protein
VTAEPAQVLVSCQDKSHAERAWEIARFTQTEPGHWLASNLKFKSELRYRAGEVKTMVWLDDERRYLAFGEPVPKGARVRHRLVCELCDLAFVRADTTVLFTILDKLAAAGVAEIDLRNLIGIADSIAT